MIDESEFLDLFIPGPVNVSEENRKKMTYPMIAHRSSTMSKLHNDIAKYLQKMLFTSNQIILSTSSSTGLMEAAIRNCVIISCYIKSLITFLDSIFCHTIIQCIII